MSGSEQSHGKLGRLEVQDTASQLACDFQRIPGPPHIQRLFELTKLVDMLPFQAAA
jgi:hypothetical protein